MRQLICDISSFSHDLLKLSIDIPLGFFQELHISVKLGSDALAELLKQFFAYWLLVNYVTIAYIYRSKCCVNYSQA